MDISEEDALLGAEMHGWATDLFPIARSLTGPGVRETLAYLGKLLPGLTVQDVPSGTAAFDWTVPEEWTVRDAYVTDEAGNRVIDFKRHNLHVMGYSEPVDLWLDHEELDRHLYSLPDQPEAIPYVTSYYTRRWGFCLPHAQREKLPPGRYHAVVDADLGPGILNYGELILPGAEEGEILLSTYVCHPSMANNELSGPMVATALARWLMSRPNRRYTYRIVFLPETIGSIVYLSRNFAAMKPATRAGFVLTCCGDERGWSYMPSRQGGTLADRAALHALRHVLDGGNGVPFTAYSFLERGSDERQYCSPGIDLPVCSVMRSKYACYPEYHTSLDDLSLIAPAGLAGSFRAMRTILELVEANRVWRATTPCEPQLGKRGLYPTVSTRDSGRRVRTMMNVLAYADGTRDLIALAEHIGAGGLECAAILEKLAAAGLVEIAD